MAGAEALVLLLVAVAVLAAFGLRYDVPYPIVLVVGGLALGFVPWLPALDLDPDVDAAELQIEALEAERDVLAGMRREREFPAELLRELEAEIDVDEARVRSRGR